MLLFAAVKKNRDIKIIFMVSAFSVNPDLLMNLIMVITSGSQKIPVYQASLVIPESVITIFGN
jgi:hypothetical protein